MTELPVTKEGMDKVQKELNFLITVEREELKIVISDARDLGDLKENAEYHAAKEKQSIMEGRIMQLQGIVASGRIIDPSTIVSDVIVFGATVTLLDVEKNEKVTYQLVGESESNMKQGKVSFTSPLGRALIGKEEGDTIIVKAPKGDIEYEVESFDYI